MANKKAEILTMDGQVVSPITLATNVLLDDGHTAQDLLDSRDESMFSPTITTSSSISKVGQGDNVDFSENVIDGAYGSCVLKGKTLVNYNAEGNDRNDYTCMPSVEGSGLTVNGTVEGKVKSAILSGQTLVNLVKSYSYSNNTIYANLTYILAGEKTFITRLINNDFTITKIELVVKNAEYQYLTLKENTKFKHSTTREYNTLKITLTKDDGTNLSEEELKSIKILLLEYKEGMENWDIPYFEGMQSVKMPVLTTTGKNLMPINSVIPELWSGDILNHKICDLKLKPNTSYTFSNEFDGVSNTIRTRIHDDNNTVLAEVWGNQYKTFTTNTSENYWVLAYDFGNGNIIEGIQIEEGAIKTPYEPYKSNILSTSEDVVLRGIGNVRDELDLLTGEVTESVSEVVLDGTNTPNIMFLEPNRAEGYTVFPMQISDVFPNMTVNYNNYTQLISNNFNYLVGGYLNRLAGKWMCINAMYFVLSISNDELESLDIQGLNKWLSLNKTTIYYPSEKSIKTVDLSDNHVYSYKDTTHYTCSSEDGSLLPTLAIEEGVKYEAIIKPSTKYSIIFNRTEVASGLTVDLGGATTNVVSTTLGKNIVQITTLPTLSHNYVIFKGLGNVIKDVQVIEGEVAGDIEYFEGMVDVKNPSVMNCNTLDTEDENYKSNTVTTNEVVLRSLPNGVNDTLDLETGEYVQRIGEREYQVGDESNSQVLTDKVNTQYELATPIITTIDLKQHPFAYKDGYVVLTSSGEEISLTPTIEYSLIANRLGQIQSNQKLVEKQQAQINELESMVIANLVNTQYQQALNEIKLGVK